MIAPELVVTIAGFLPVASDMFRYLVALPAPILTKPLQSLYHLFILQSKGLLPNGKTYEVSKKRYNYCQIELWPYLNIPYPRLEAHIIKLFEECIGLYSRIELHVALQCFEIPPTAWFGVSVVGFNNFKVEGEDNEDSENSEDSEDSDQSSDSTVEDLQLSLWNGDMESAVFEEVVCYLATIPRLQHITMDWIYDEKKYLKFLQMLGCFKHLTSLELLSDGYLGEEEKKALEKWCTSEPPKKLTLYCELGGGESEYFKCCPTWLGNRPSKLEFRGEQLTGVQYGVYDDKTGEYACDFVKQWNGEMLATSSDNINCPYLSWNWELPYIKAVSNMSNLRHVYFRTIFMDAKCCKYLALLLPQLEELSLIDNRLDNRKAEDLVKVLPRCRKLSRFFLVSQYMVTCSTAIGIADAIASGAGIRHLNLSGNHISNFGAIALSNVVHYLEVLALRRNSIELKGASSISKASSKTGCYLTHIDLRENYFTAKHVEDITANLKQSDFGLAKFEISRRNA